MLINDLLVDSARELIFANQTFRFDMAEIVHRLYQKYGTKTGITKIKFSRRLSMLIPGFTKNQYLQMIKVVEALTVKKKNVSKKLLRETKWSILVRIKDRIGLLDDLDINEILEISIKLGYRESLSILRKKCRIKKQYLMKLKENKNQFRASRAEEP